MLEDDLTLVDYVNAMREATERRQAAEAKERGITLEELHRQHEAEEQARRNDERDEQARGHRRRQLRRVEPHLTERAIHALIFGKQPRKTPAIIAVHRWLKAGPDAPPVLVLTGGTGCGKTFAAAYAMTRWSRSVEYVRASNLAERYEPYSGDLSRDVEPLRMSASLMVVDDIGTERRNADGRRDGRFMPALSDVVDSRMKLRTLITTNLNRGAFLDEYADDRLRSRFEEVAYFHGCGTEDLRRRR